MPSLGSAFVRRQAAQPRRVGDPAQSETMKTDDNRSATASPRGGVESSVVGTRSTAIQVNTIRRQPWTSLRAKGEVAIVALAAMDTHGLRHGGSCVASGVVGGSRSGRGGACEDGRPVGAGNRKRCPIGVTAVIRAEKWGNAHGAKGGRKVERSRP